MAESTEGKSPRARRHPRFSYRAQSHHTAHAGAAATPEPIPEHPLIPRNTPPLIGSPGALAELIEHIRAIGSFAYDSEFIGEMSYLPKLCLIQVATAQRVVLVDPLAELDLRAFWELVADPSIEKIVHCGQQDLEPVYRQIGRPAAGIFDTQIAAGFIGLAYPVGLSKLVRELVGARLGKGFTFTHWDHRPLSSVQMRYAADDVRYLPALRQVIGRRLEALGHVGWVREACDALCDPAQYRDDDGRGFTRIRGANTLSPQHLAVLRELYAWRDSAARQQDVPPRTYLKDEILLELARRPIRNVDALAKVRGLPRPVELSQGQHIVEATARGLAIPEAQQPPVKQIEENPSERLAIDALWATIAAWCAGQSVEPALVTSRQEVARIYRHLRLAGNLPEDTPLLAGWRGELLGKTLRRFLSGEGEIRLQWQHAALRSAELQPEKT